MERDSDLERFESLLSRTLRGEVSSTDYEPHIGMEALLSMLADELSASAQEEVSEHLERCPVCSERYAQLKQLVEKEKKELLASTTYSEVATLLATHSDRTRWLRLKEWLSQPLVGRSRPWAIGTVGAVAAVTVVALVLLLVLPSTRLPWTRLTFSLAISEIQLALERDVPIAGVQAVTLREHATTAVTKSGEKVRVDSLESLYEDDASLQVELYAIPECKSADFFLIFPDAREHSLGNRQVGFATFMVQLQGYDLLRSGGVYGLKIVAHHQELDDGEITVWFRYQIRDRPREG